MNLTLTYFWIFGVAVLSDAGALRAELPKGYEAREGLTSPNGQYEIFIPDDENAAPDPYNTSNYVVDVKAKKVLTEIEHCHYFPHANHRGLDAAWKEDSKMVLMEMEEHWGFEALVLLELNQRPVRQTEIGKEVQRQCDSAVKKANKNQRVDVYSNAYYDFLPNGEIQLYATGDTNPKGFEDKLTICVLLQGRYSVAKHRWTNTSTQIISGEQSFDYEATFTEVPAREEDDREDMRDEASLDKRLNQVYRTLHLLLPAKRFAQVKQEQAAWLPKRDAAQDPRAQRDLLRQRVIELKALLW